MPESGSPDLDPAKLFAPLADERHVLAAVSGGSDSLALLHMLHRWTRSRDGPTLSVATVDHGLRPESGREALQVGDICTRLGLEHRIEKWRGGKPKSGVSQAARNARYELLSKAARSTGASAIVLGHTMDDQHETVLMRAERTGISHFDRMPDISASRGLAGMRPEAAYCGPPNFEPLRLYRPLLIVCRKELRGVLGKLGVTWIDDPSNDDLHYERIRMRRALAAGSDNYPGRRHICRFAGQVAELRSQLSRDCAELIVNHVRFRPSGVIEIAAEAISGPADGAASFLLRVLISIAGGRAYLVPPMAAIDLLARLRSRNIWRQTLGSAIIERRGDSVLFWRENRNLPVTAYAGNHTGSMSWDGRIVYHCSERQQDQEFLMAPLGLAGVQYVERQSGARIGGCSRHALRTQPALFYRGNPVFVPFNSWCEPEYSVPDHSCWTPAIQMFQADCDQVLVDAVNYCRKA